MVGSLHRLFKGWHHLALLVSQQASSSHLLLPVGVEVEHSPSSCGTFWKQTDAFFFFPGERMKDSGRDSVTK